MTLAESEATELVRVHSLSGPSFAGHGPIAGEQLHVLRLGMCNLACQWCDQRDTVTALGADLDTTAPLRTVNGLLPQLLSQLDADPEVPLLITGGEPLVQDYAILALLGSLRHDHDWHGRVYVETNGTKPVPDWWDAYVKHTVVTPKVGTHDPQRKRLPAALEQWAHQHAIGLATFHFTARNRSDVWSAAAVCTWLGASPNDCYISPEGSTLARELQSLALVHPAAIEHGFCLSPRIGPLLDTDFTP